MSYKGKVSGTLYHRNMPTSVSEFYDAGQMLLKEIKWALSTDPHQM
jgi:hypothetical protein